MAIRTSDETARAREGIAAAGGVEAAEAFVRALVAHGVDCLFLNPGTDTFPIQEAISKLEQLGQPVVRTILCPFELVALAAAHDLASGPRWHLGGHHQAQGPALRPALVYPSRRYAGTAAYPVTTCPPRS